MHLLSRALYTFLLFISFTTYANPSVRLGVENSWPPYSNSLGDGISKEIVQQAFNTMNINVHFVVLPYARALKMTENGDLDGAFNVTKQQSTINKFNFHETPILQAKASFYYPKGSPLNYQSISEIPEKTTIALILDYEYGNAYETRKNSFNELRVSQQQQIILLLLKQRVDMAIMFDEVAKHTLAQMNLPKNAIKKGHINHISDIYVAFSKERNTAPLIEAFNQGLKKVHSQTKH